MPQVASDQRRLMRQSNGRNQQVRPADLLQFLVLPESVELARDGAVDGKYGDLTKQFLAAHQPGESPKQFFAIRRLEDEVEPSLQDFDSSDGRGGNLRGLELLAPLPKSWVPGVQPRERIRVQQIH